MARRALCKYGRGVVGVWRVSLILLGVAQESQSWTPITTNPQELKDMVLNGTLMKGITDNIIGVAGAAGSEDGTAGSSAEEGATKGHLFPPAGSEAIQDTANEEPDAMATADSADSVESTESAESAEPLECAPELAEDKCDYYLSSPHCWTERKQVLIDYKQFYYCTLGGNPVGLVLLFFWALVVFQVLAIAADDFFSPAVDAVVDIFKVPSDIAGAVLLSFGNGAPDVFTQVSAVCTDGASPDVLLALSSVTGSGLFINCIVLGIVILVSRKVIVVDKTFRRDSLAYLASLVLIFGVMADGRVELWQSSMLAAFYTAYLCVVIFTGRQDAAPTEIEEPSAIEDCLLNQIDSLEKAHGLQDQPSIPKSASSERLVGLHATMVFFKDRLDWENKTQIQKLMAPITVPVNVIMGLTMSHEEPSRVYGGIMSICGPVFFLMSMGFEPGHASKFFFLLFSMVMLFAAVYATSGRELMLGDWLMPAVTFVQSILWMKLSANTLVDMLELVGKIMGLSPAFLGATVLAWGSSMADLMANMAIARKQPNMAVTACIAGPLFNLLVGSSLALICQNMNSGVVQVELDNQVLLLIGVSILVMGYCVYAVPALHKWKLNRGIGLILLILYAVVTGVYILIQTGAIFTTPWL